ncbi:O-antigen ligase family protein [Cellulomonas hominis]|uniref:O-antigen ligase family protein n=1 Tax=Cellulomonas hominis TaxID=156981 RepID=UPI0014439B09|nr:O-antigen ligase family protein [Cellulomonas hominis]NKY09162.1 O-antigen ligase domain-containing protein [Cellulomonas hominis]
MTATDTAGVLPADPGRPDRPATSARAVLAPPRHDARRRTVLGAGLVVLGVVIALLVAVHPLVALGTGAVVLALGLTVRQPVMLPVLSMPALLVVNRLGGDALSVSDFVLFVVFWPALLFGARPLSRPMRTMLWANAFYQACVLFTVVANPYLANAVEWVHAWVLVGGALVVGWAVGAAGYARLGLGLYVAGALVIALATLATFVVQAAHGDLQPVYLGPPFLMHKNVVGCVLAFAAVIVYTRPRWLRWNDLVCTSLFLVFVLGILAAQSRQALIGLSLSVAIVALRPDPHHHRSKFVLVAVVIGGAMVGTLVQEQLDSGDQYNSAYQRLTWFREALLIWQQYPLFGAGLRWWYTDRFDEKFQPPNAEFEMLSSAGIVGVLAFLLMFLVMLVALWRVDQRFGTLAFVIVLMRFVQGQFDLFWVAAQVSIPFAVAGVCLGAHEHARRRHELEPVPVAPRPRRLHRPHRRTRDPERPRVRSAS